MSWLGGRRGTVELRKSGVKQWDPNQAAFLAERAEVDQLARELVKESWPISRRGGQKQGSGIDVEQLAAAGDFVLDLAIGQPAEVADANEAGGQDVQEEAAEEFEGIEGKGLCYSSVTIVFPGKRDAAVFDHEQAMVGNSDPVGVAAEILDDLSGAAKGPFGVDDPAPVGGEVQPAAEGCRVREPGQIAEEGELSLLEGLEQGLAEESTEASAENLNRQEEVFALFGALARDPALAVGRQSSAWDDTMQMGMMGELLAPGVEDGEEAELGTQVFGIGGNRMQSGGHGLEEQVVDYRFILQGQPGDRFRQGEDEVEVDDRQQLLLAGGNPAGFGQGLALGAMAVAAGVVGGALVTTAGIVTPLEMAAQSRSATQNQSVQHGSLGQRQGGTIGIEKSAAATAHYFSDLQNGFGHKAPPVRSVEGWAANPAGCGSRRGWPW